MKSIYIILFTLWATWGCPGGELAKSVRFEPLSFEVCKTDTNIRYGRDFSKGTKLEFEAVVEENLRKNMDVEDCFFWEVCYFWQRRPELATLSCIDSQGVELGKIRELSGMEYEDETFSFILTFSGLPSPDANWLRLRGEMPVTLIESDEMKTGKIPLQVRKNAEADGEQFKLIVSDIKEEEKKHYRAPKQGVEHIISTHSVKLSVLPCSDQYQVFDVKLIDAEGRFVHVPNGFNESHALCWPDFESQKVSWVCLLTGLPDKVDAVVTYRKVKKQTAPVDAKFDLKPVSEKKEP